MQTARAVGRQAASRKYDIVTALGVYALSGDGHRQTLVLRFLTLITARYNWAKDELSMGRAEMARLWSVTERTVKRELARLRTLGWMQVKRPGARGRVTVYALDVGQILLDTAEVWPVIGSDFVARMEEGRGGETAPDDTVVPFPTTSPAPKPQEGLWGQVQAALHQRHPELYAAWFRQLSEAGRQDGTVVLGAPSRFVADYVTAHLLPRLLAAYGRFDAGVRQIRVEVA